MTRPPLARWCVIYIGDDGRTRAGNGYLNREDAIDGLRRAAILMGRRPMYIAHLVAMK